MDVRGWHRATVLAAVAALVLAGCTLVGQDCCTHPPTGAPGGMSEDAAIAAARRLAPTSTAEPTVIWAQIEHDPFAQHGANDARLVWEVRLQGPFAVAPCPSGFLDAPPSLGSKACVDGDSGLIVVLDYYSGAFIGWTH
jgi:hypothetical protein